MADPDAPLPTAQLDAFWTKLVACRNDVAALLDVVARQVVEVIGDGCVLTTVTDDGTALSPRVVLHSEWGVAEAMRAALASGDVQIGEGLAGTVARDRRSIVFNDIPPETIAETTPERFRPFLVEHPMRALMIVPLVAGGELVGTLGAVRTASDAPYTTEDLRVLTALAERAALAIADAMSGPRAIGPSDHDALYRYAMDGVLYTTPDGHILAANPAACAILGLTEREIVHGGQDLVVAGDDPRLARAMAERAVAGRARAELTMRRGDGTCFEADVSSSVYTTRDGKVRACMTFRDISDEVAARQRALARVTELEQIAERDDLTSLWNRRGFAVAAEQALAAADRACTVAQLLFVDVNGLKHINDAHGHAAGDAAIVAVAEAIARTIRDVDVACRLGGDEFVVLLVDTPADEVAGIVERIHMTLAAMTETPPGLGFSTGVVERLPNAPTSLADLVDAADRDMYRQKVVQRLQQPGRPNRP